MKKRIFSIFYICTLILLIVGCSSDSQPLTQEQERALKDAQSNYYGGLNRVLTVYDQNGKVIKSYEGRIDIDPDSDGGGKVKFELNGKRIIIYNATVIAEEK
jgi:hypothetical protein